MFEIVHKLNGQWTADGIGDANEFETADEARIAIHALQAMGGDWAGDNYDIRRIGPRWEVEHLFPGSHSWVARRKP